MFISQKGIDHIKTWESLRLKAYRPLPHDRWTIGWGHTHTTYEGQTITIEEANRLLLEYDIPRMERCINRAVNVSLEQHEFDALMSFVFNIGCTAFSNSTLLKELNLGNYDRIPYQLSRWKNSGKRKNVKGLINRRNSEISMWNSAEISTVASNAKPDSPKGRSMIELAKTSKTVQASSVGVGMSVVEIKEQINEAATLKDTVLNLISNLDSLPLIVVGAICIFLIYNRWRDSQMGRAY